MAWCCAMTAFFASLVVLTVLANLDQVTAATAELPAIMIVPTLMVGAIGALVGWFLAGPAPKGPEPVEAGDGSIQLIDLSADPHPVWHGHLTSKLLTSLTAVTLVLGLALLPLSPVGGLCIIVAVPVLAVMCSIDVVADETGLTVRFGPFGLPRKHIAIERIADAKAEDIVPLEWGGWGYRVMPGKSAVVMRGGSAIVLNLADGKQFAVTIDDARGAVRVLEIYRYRSGLHR
jgi:hypothetical protein